MAMSEEHKEKLRIGREKAQARKRLEALESVPEVKEIADKLEQPETEPEEVAPEESVADLKRQIEELKNFVFNQQAPQSQGPQVNQRGKLIGQFEKYNVDPSAYPDPSERLSKEPSLAPFAFDVNYELSYEVAVSSYETKEGVNMKEPRFHIELRRIKLNDDGTPSNDRYIIRKMVWHEDPQAAIIVARENDLPIDESNEAQFLEEMRYLRVRDWLLGIFYPKPAQKAKQTRDVVVDGQAVQMITINSETPQGIPFSELRN